MKPGAQLIMEERVRQQSVEGFTPEHDDKHTNFELTEAAVIYSAAAGSLVLDKTMTSTQIELVLKYLGRWPWSSESLKISSDPINNLIKAGALIAAEIDRLQRVNK